MPEVFLRCECDKEDCKYKLGEYDWQTIRFNETLFPIHITSEDRKRIYHPKCKYRPSDAVEVKKNNRIIGWVGS